MNAHPQKRYRWILIGCLACLGSVSCGEEEPVGPGTRELADAGKPVSSDPTVSATDPTSAPQDTTLDVRVIGSSFDRGSRADLALNCEVECVLSEKTKTNSTRFVSSSELVASITIAADATIELYDVLVTTSKGKRGIGIELFAVRESSARSASKEYTQTVMGKLPGAGSCRSTEINELGDVAGYCSFGSGINRAFFWRDSLGMLDLGDVSPKDPLSYVDLSDGGSNGPIVVGLTQLYGPTIWEPIVGSAPIPLPSLPGGGCIAQARAITGAADLIVGRACVVVGGQTVSMPITWRRNGAGWSDPEPLLLPSGRDSGAAWHVSKNGVIAGTLNPSTNPSIPDWFVWFPPYTSPPEPLPFGHFSNIWVEGVNDSGDAAGSGEGHYVAFWKRNVAGWELYEISDTGSAYGINNRGEVVGTWEGGLRVWSLGTSTYVDHGYGYDINDTGGITGRDEDGNLRGRAVKWEPKP